MWLSRQKRIRSSNQLEALKQAYEQTDYWVFAPSGTFCLRIGERSAKLAQCYRESQLNSAALVTACNPWHRRTDNADNLLTTDRLRVTLESLTQDVFDATNRSVDIKWPEEPSFLALGISRSKALRIAQEYKQNAVLWADSDAVPHLLWSWALPISG
ncbi:MAG: DUF3293 domain-containing protein [Pseudomonadota bacterium]